MSFNIRPMVEGDLFAIEQIQAEAYAGYFLESAEVIAQRFNLSPATAWVASHQNHVCAYLVGYCSTVGKINPLNAPFTTIENADCLYLHDLAIAKSAQGFGVAKKLVHAAIAFAEQTRLQSMALLSVQHSKQFWSAFGFVEYADLELRQQENLQTYITDNESAYYMTRRFY